jgi:hypothetical protein
MPLKIIAHELNQQHKHSIRLSRVREKRPQLVARVGWRTISYGILDNTKNFDIPNHDLQAGDLPELTKEWGVYGADLNIWPYGHPISMCGDSGSWIINSEGDLVALLWGGDGINYAFVTPIEDVVSDIEDQTGYIVVLRGGVDPLTYSDGDLPTAYKK